VLGGVPSGARAATKESVGAAGGGGGIRGDPREAARPGHPAPAVTSRGKHRSAERANPRVSAWRAQGVGVGDMSGGCRGRGGQDGPAPSAGGRWGTWEDG